MGTKAKGEMPPQDCFLFLDGGTIAAIMSFKLKCAALHLLLFKVLRTPARPGQPAVKGGGAGGGRDD